MIRPATSHTIQPFWVRTTHWLNAFAVVIMVFSGWQIYNASPIFAFRFPPKVTLGGWLAAGIEWHFAAMWLLFCNAIVYLLLNLVSGRIRARFWPLSARELISDLVAAVTLRLKHQDVARYNAIQKLAYLLVWADILVLILSGMVLWKSVQFPHLRMLFGNYDVARRVHFFAMSLLVAFTLVHVIMVAIVPRSLLTMLRGR
jgi:thiosulfate reductase cytochrome b subunit